MNTLILQANQRLEQETFLLDVALQCFGRKVNPRTDKMTTLNSKVFNFRFIIVRN